MQDINLSEDNLYLFDKSGNEIKTYNVSHEQNTVKLFIPRNQNILDGVYFLYSGGLEKNLEPEYSTFAKWRRKVFFS